MRLLTDEQHAQIVEALEALHKLTSFRFDTRTYFAQTEEALATLTAAPSVDVAAYASYGEEINKPLYAIKKETP